MPILDKDMTLCISLAGRPSNLGTRFHDCRYDEFGLNFIYKAFTTDDIAGAVAGIRALGIRGCSVSMPFAHYIGATPTPDQVARASRSRESERPGPRSSAARAEVGNSPAVAAEVGKSPATPSATCPKSRPTRRATRAKWATHRRSRA